MSMMRGAGCAANLIAKVIYFSSLRCRLFLSLSPVVVTRQTLIFLQSTFTPADEWSRSCKDTPFSQLAWEAQPPRGCLCVTANESSSKARFETRQQAVRSNTSRDWICPYGNFPLPTYSGRKREVTVWRCTSRPLGPADLVLYARNLARLIQLPYMSGNCMIAAFEFAQREKNSFVGVSIANFFPQASSSSMILK